MTGIAVSADKQLTACLEAIPNMADMKFTGPDLDCGPPRPPILPLTAEEQAMLFARAAELGALDVFAKG